MRAARRFDAGQNTTSKGSRQTNPLQMPTERSNRMSKEIEQQEIRKRAYALWEDAGSPEGREDEFWIKAKHLLEEEKGHINVDSASEERFPASDAVNHM